MNSLSVGVFSCKRIAPQFPPLWRDSPSSTGQRKVRLSEGRPILVTFHLFLVLVGATNIFSELIHPLLKLPNCVLKQQLQILQLSEALGSARLGFLPLREEGTGFVGVLPLPSTHVWSSRKHYIVHGNNALASPALRIRACEAHELALTLLLPYSKPILEKNRLFCSLKSERHWQ